jgi:branched-chain amino acid transport system permease protein
MFETITVLAQEGVDESSVIAEWLVDGLSLGAIYALLAMGFVIIFKATQVVNFAHGALAAVGAFLVASFATILQVPGRWMPESPQWLTWGLSLLFALAAAAVIGIAIERLFIRPMVGEELIMIAVVTLGIDIAMRNITNDFIGTQPRPMGDPWGTSITDLGFVTVAHTQIAQVVAAVVLVLAVALFFRSKTGIAMRATAFDQEAARAQGISVGRIFSTAWAIGAVLAAVAGMFISLFPRRSSGVDTLTAFFVFRAFPAIILGGLDSVVGAVVGGFTIGLAEAFATTFLQFEILGRGFSGVVPFLVMLIVLLVRPYGIFGTEEIRRV